jgi:hypothetical protein
VTQWKICTGHTNGFEIISKEKFIALDGKGSVNHGLCSFHSADSSMRRNSQNGVLGAQDPRYLPLLPGSNVNSENKLNFGKKVVLAR